MSHTPEIIKTLCIDLAVDIGRTCRRLDLPDEAIWDLARTMDRVFQKHRKKLASNGNGVSHTEEREHPAIQHLMDTLREDGGRHDDAR